MSTLNLSTEERAILEELKCCLQQMLGNRLRKLVLFGSRARGDWEDGSDIDIAIVVSGLDAKLKDLILVRVAELELEYLTPLSTLVFSEEDFNHLKSRERRIALDIEREGVPL